MVRDWGWHWIFGGPGILAGLMMLLLLVLVVALVVWFIVRLARSSSSGQPRDQMGAHRSAAPPPALQPDPALEILRRRLASGEITAEEFDALRQKLDV